MAGFDPYYKWLGIPPEQQPPNHYRLLGIELFEADPDAISNAADRQMTHVRSFQTGQNSEVSQRILNEIAAARVCLLSPAKKFAYDVALKEQLRPQVAPVVSRRSASQSNTQIVLLTLAAAAVCVLVVVLLLSRSKPTVARTPSTEEPVQAQEKSPAKPRHGKEVEPKPQQKVQPEPKPKSETNVRISDFAGTWAIKYGDGAVRVYTLDSDGLAVFPEENRQGRVFTKYGKVLLDFGDGKLERLELVDSKLQVEHFDPATAYPDDAPRLFGVGERQRGQSQQVAQTKTEPGAGASSEATNPTTQVEGVPGYVDLLSRVDLDRDFVAGGWTREAVGLTTAPKSRIRLPVKVNGSYDLLVTFTRLEGDGDVALLLPVGSHQCAMFFSAWNGRVHGLDIIDGQEGLNNPINTRPGPLTNGQRYTALVKVRLMKDENARIEALLDNSLVVRWQGKESSLVLREDRMIRPYQIGLGTWDSVAAFHSARFRLISGHASWIGSGEAIAQAGPTESAEGELPTGQLTPVPDKASRDKARAEAKELFGADHAAAKGSPEKLSALAARILQQASELQDAATQYTLLDIARTISIEAGDITLAVQAVDSLSERFAIDASALKGESVEVVVKSPHPREKINALLEALAPLIDACLANNDFTLAKNVGAAAAALARKTRDGGIVKQVTARNREIEELEQVFQKEIQPAVERLKQAPNDPAANLIVGKYICFTKGDWHDGLAKLAACDDAAIRELAAREVAGLAEPSEKLKVADGWWELSQKDEKHKQPIQAHAADLYQQLPGLTGLDKLKAEQRIKLSMTKDDKEASRRRKIKGRIYAACDDKFVMYINGQQVLEGGLRMETADYAFARGDVITVKAIDTGEVKQFCCAIEFEKGETIVSGPRWSGYVPVSQEEWYRVKGATYRVVPSPPPGTEQVKAIQAAAGATIMPIWGQGNPCYLMLRIK